MSQLVRDRGSLGHQLCLGLFYREHVSVTGEKNMKIAKKKYLVVNLGADPNAGVGGRHNYGRDLSLGLEISLGLLLSLSGSVGFSVSLGIHVVLRGGLSSSESALLGLGLVDDFS